VKDVNALVARGSITETQAQPMLDGAAAILEQIEGNWPNKADANESDSISQEGLASSAPTVVKLYSVFTEAYHRPRFT
jgi:hypothetical protein